MAEPEEISLLDELRRLADADPFAPFTIVMASGERYDVDPTDTLAFARNVIYLFAHRKGLSLLRPNQITEAVVPGGAL
jgi:hypothetical protein